MRDPDAARRVLVTGATGALGPTLVTRLSAERCRIRILLQPGTSARMLPDDVEIVEGDIDDASALEQAGAGVDCIFHLAALLHINNPTPELKPAYERVNVLGTQTLTRVAQAAGVRRLVFFSTISVYGPTHSDEIHTETSALAPQTYYAETKAQAEQIVLAAKRTMDGAPLGTVLRLAAVYGARIKGNYAILYEAIRRGWFLPMGRGQSRRTLVYDKDVAQAAWLAATHPDAAGRIYNVTDGAVHTLDEIITAVRGSLGKRPYRMHIPLSIAQVGAHVATALSRLAGHPYPADELLSKYTEDVAVDGSAIRRDLGFVPHYGLAQGWGELVSAQDGRAE